MYNLFIFFSQYHKGSPMISCYRKEVPSQDLYIDNLTAEPALSTYYKTMMETLKVEKTLSRYCTWSRKTL